MIPNQQFCRTCPIDRSMSIDLNNWGRSIFSDPCHPCFRNKFSEIVSAAATCQTRLSSAVSSYSRTTVTYRLVCHLLVWSVQCTVYTWNWHQTSSGQGCHCIFVDPTGTTTTKKGICADALETHVAGALISCYFGKLVYQRRGINTTVNLGTVCFPFIGHWLVFNYSDYGQL